MAHIQSTGFLVEFQGDETVGMFSQQWHILGDFIFESEEELSGFKFKISQAFEFCSDKPISVESLEERSARINEELAAFPGAFHSGPPRLPHPACKGDCGMNYCDENGCTERKRVLTDPIPPDFYHS